MCLVSKKINLTTKIQSGLIDINEIVSKDHLLEKKFSPIIINMPQINFWLVLIGPKYLHFELITPKLWPNFPN